MFFAGIVLFNPCITRLKENIDSIYKQVSCVVCVDNNSSNLEEIKDLLNKYERVIFTKNKKNMGIGYALNQIVDWGKANGLLWCLTLDQDSICPKNIISEYKKYIVLNDVAIISPVIEDANQKDKNINYTNEFRYIDDSEEVITSGALINLDICCTVGRFNEEMFIDFIDIEYNKRLLINGYKIIRVNSVKLFHEIGKIKEYNILLFKVCCTNHSSFRRYYMVRNRLYYTAKYCKKAEFYKAFLKLLLGTIKIWFFECEKISKTSAMFKGCRDYKYLFKSK